MGHRITDNSRCGVIGYGSWATALVHTLQKNKKEVLAYYRIPAVCTVKLMDGANLLLQSRMPVYQLGQESSLPVNVILK